MVGHTKENVSYANQPHRWEQKQPPISSGVKAKLGATAIDLKNYLRRNESYQEDERANAEYRETIDRLKRINAARQNYPDYYHDWQIECLETIKGKKNVILSSPTGSGKTTVYLDWAKEKIKEAEADNRPDHMVYITAPIKSLSNQRYKDLKDAGYMVGLETGDVKKVPNNAQYICCTQEIYNNKYKQAENATLIVDEFHYISESQDRSRAYIDSLHDSKAKNVLLCSATFGSIDKLDNYIEKVSKRSFDSYENKERLTDLHFEGYISPEEIRDALVVAFSAQNCECVANSLADMSNGADEETVNEIKEVCASHKVAYDDRMARGIATYYGKKIPKEKACIEELFEKRLIDTVVGTDALALGVNFPVDKVVFAQLAKYDGVISKNLFEQLAGRAGRKGFFDKGYVYYCDSFRNDKGYPLEPREYNYVPQADEEEDDDKDNEYGYRRRYNGWDYIAKTPILYEQLMKKQNEDIEVVLSPDIKKVISGESTIEEESEYIRRYSSREDVFTKRIEWDVEIVYDFINDNRGKSFVRSLLSQDEISALDAAESRYSNYNYEPVTYEDDRVIMNPASGSNQGWFVRDKETNAYYFLDFKKTKDEKYILNTDYSATLHQSGKVISSADEKSKIETICNRALNHLDAIRERNNRNIEECEKRIQEVLSDCKNKFIQEIKSTYTNELNPSDNCMLCLALMDGRGEDIFGIIDDEDEWGYDYGDEEGDDNNGGEPLPSPIINVDDENLEDLIKKRRIIMGLPKKYRERFDMVALEEKINSIDDTVLNIGGEKDLFGASDIQTMLESEDK